MSRWAVRGALMASWLVVLLSVAPVGASATETEPAASEVPATDVTTLALEPVCATDGLYRFAVNHVDGPGTHFIVGAGDGTNRETMAIEAGQTRHFWVEESGSVEIAWAGGSASATGVDVECAPDIAPPAGTFVTPSTTDAPPTNVTPQTSDAAPTDAPPPAPRPSDSPSPHPTPEASEPPTASEAPGAVPAAPADRRPRSDGPEPATDPQTTQTPAEDHPAAGGSQAEPRPRLLDGAMVCPDGWIPVDNDADGRFEASDTCEVLIETAAQASPVGAAFPTVALIVTIGLLVASMGWGVFVRQRA